MGREAEQKGSKQRLKLSRKRTVPTNERSMEVISGRKKRKSHVSETWRATQIVNEARLRFAVMKLGSS